MSSESPSGDYNTSADSISWERKKEKRKVEIFEPNILTDCHATNNTYVTLRQNECARPKRTKAMPAIAVLDRQLKYRKALDSIVYTLNLPHSHSVSSKLHIDAISINWRQWRISWKSAIASFWFACTNCTSKKPFSVSPLLSLLSYEYLQQLSCRNFECIRLELSQYFLCLVLSFIGKNQQLAVFTVKI